MTRALMHLCPICKIFDPAWLIHARGCEFYVGNLTCNVALVALRYRTRLVVIRGAL